MANVIGRRLRWLGMGLMAGLVLLASCASAANTAIPAPTASAATATPGRFTSPASAELSRQVDAIMESFIESTTPGGAVIVVRDGQILHKAAYGLADLEQATPLTPKSVFHLASVGKQFTAMGILLLAEEGKLKVDDPIGTYLPQLARFGNELTIRHLLNHTSGLPEVYEDDSLFEALLEQSETPTNRDVLTVLSTLGELQSAPGAEFSYSNIGYEVLGSLIEAISGQPLRDFMQQRIFGPLKMDHTFSLPDPRRRSSPEIAHSYTTDGGEATAYDSDPLDNAVGSGSVYSTVEDLALYEQALTNNTLVRESSMNEALTPPTLADGSQSDYGFGWTVGDYNGVPSVSHDGHWLAFITAYARFPEQRLAVIVLLNRDYDLPEEDLAMQIADIYLEQ